MSNNNSTERNNNEIKNDTKAFRPVSCRDMELGIQHHLDVSFEEIMNNKRYENIAHMFNWLY